MIDWDELLYELLEIGESKSIATIWFDSEYWTINSVDYSIIKIGDRFLIICLLPEKDFDDLSICMCKNKNEVDDFLSNELDNYNQMDGTDIKIDGNILKIMNSLQDKSNEIIELMDEYFNSEFENNMTNELKQLIKPSDLIKTFLNENGLRPKNPNGFLIDESDNVYIRNGSIWFSPIGGNEKYFSTQLGMMLDCLGIKWQSQRFVLSHENFNNLQNSPSPDEFIHMFKTSKQILKERQYNSKMSELLEKKKTIDKEIDNLIKQNKN